ncbi:DUF1156 domain-containing protein [Sporolactobacillus sp. THM19-2]|uniref:DUF1156 domain-containing protein n=1 Tax=Sporolactobacillus sp. THM19-2 TaxID=2511171 RepID=UPI00101F5631|nr:DUF1156 domain-containing protein [Sporolactobacillus sp. THM19-2]RYL92592.1 DUF1156 domain-containing protein [Sporolactobacillus sp. THM19-2]
MTRKKLIEVALPLDAINQASAREKSIRHGHPSTLHLWWARRPLAAARAVIFASLVDDPSSHPEQFPTEEAQLEERNRLFSLLEKLVKWENSNNREILDQAKAEICKSTNGNPPPLFDPFAGGGSIPLEAQRLGLEAHAGDLNPVAVMINKAMIEIPPKFADHPAVNPKSRTETMDNTWSGTEGLAEDVRYYGEWMKKEAFKRIGNLYPKVDLPKKMGGGKATVIAWIWARTVKCPNPACGCEMPLASSFILSKKKDHEAYVDPVFDYEAHKIHYEVKYGKPAHLISPKISRGAKFKCIMCGEATTEDYIKQTSKAGQMGSTLIGVVAEGTHGRIYLSPDHVQVEVAEATKRPVDYPDGELAYDPRNLWCTGYGLDTFSKLFTNRQLTALTTFSDLIREAQKKVKADAIAAGMANDGIQLSKGGAGAQAYGEAVGVYLAFAVDREADICSTIASWLNTIGAISHTFARQAIPMVWDYAEANPFSHSSGCFDNMLKWVVEAAAALPANNAGIASQHNAAVGFDFNNVVISTDPPYYDNIGYADLSDFFYIWLRRTLKRTFPKLFSTLLVPKAEELVATPYRFNGQVNEAKHFFENGMIQALGEIYKSACEDIPVTVYYAYKQSEKSRDKSGNKEISSTGWATMLTAIIQSGFVITGTWPMRTERANRTNGIGTNSLASSIVLVCRKRPVDAPMGTRRQFINGLKRELRPALFKLQQSNIAPVDLAQSAIGPGMAVFSKYTKVLEADGTPMSVRSALQIINQELDTYLSEQSGNLDQYSRFCVDLYEQYAYNTIKYGEAEVLANAKNVSINQIEREKILQADKGVVRLLTREELPEDVKKDGSLIWLLAQQLTRAMETGKGNQEAARIVAQVADTNVEDARALVYRLFTIAERKKWTKEAFAFNSLVTAWPDIQNKAAELRRQDTQQLNFFQGGDQ